MVERNHPLVATPKTITGSGTSTPNPLIISRAIPRLLPLSLTRCLSWANAVDGFSREPAIFGRFCADGSGVNRGVGSGRSLMTPPAGSSLTPNGFDSKASQVRSSTRQALRATGARATASPRRHVPTVLRWRGSAKHLSRRYDSGLSRTTTTPTHGSFAVQPGGSTIPPSVPGFAQPTRASTPVCASNANLSGIPQCSRIRPSTTRAWSNTVMSTG